MFHQKTSQAGYSNILIFDRQNISSQRGVIIFAAYLYILFITYVQLGFLCLCYWVRGFRGAYSDPSKHLMRREFQGQENDALFENKALSYVCAL
jgi:hypothetical protein